MHPLWRVGVAPPARGVPVMGVLSLGTQLMWVACDNSRPFPDMPKAMVDRFHREQMPPESRSAFIHC